MAVSTSNFAPATKPSFNDWQDALQKGLGRALLWAKNGEIADKSLLLNACSIDLRYDRQCEKPRGDWLWEIMEVAGAMEDLREPILESLKSAKDAYAAQQLCQFAVHYATRGDHRFRDALERVVEEKPDSTGPWLGESQLIRLNGASGFITAVKVRSKWLETKDFDLDHWALFRKATDILGQDAIAQALDEALKTTPELKGIVEGWHAWNQHKTPVDTKSNHKKRMQQFTVEDVIQAVEGQSNQTWILLGWGKHASEADLQIILNRLFECGDTQIVERYLRVFSNRSLPQFDARLLTLLDHDDEQVKSRAYVAVAKNAHPSIRSFALMHLPIRYNDRNFVDLFIKNFQPGDESLLIEHLELPDNDDGRHELLTTVLDILEKNENAIADVLALWIYRWTPCALCRNHAAKLLFDRTNAPQWLGEECQHDSYTDTRELVSGVMSSS